MIEKYVLVVEVNLIKHYIGDETTEDDIKIIRGDPHCDEGLRNQVLSFFSRRKAEEAKKQMKDTCEQLKRPEDTVTFTIEKMCFKC